MRVQRTVTRILVVLAILITAALILRAILNSTTGKKLDSYLRAAKAAGTPLAVKDMVPSCPDSDNAAVLWRAVEALFLRDQADRDLMDRTVNDLSYGKSPDEPGRSRLAALANKNRKSLDLMIEAGDRACFRYGDWSQSSLSVSRPNAISLIQMTRLLAIQAVLRADAGQVGQALDECRSAMRFVRKLPDEPLLITGLIALAEMKILLISVMHITQTVDLAPETMASWIAELDPLAWRSRFLRCLSGERAFILECGLDVLKGKRLILEDMDRNGFFQRLFYWMIRPALKSELVWIQEYFEDLQKNANQPYGQMTGFFEKSHKKISERPWYFSLTGVLLPELDAAFLKEATLEAMMLASRAGLACRIYKKQTGRYPENLSALVPGILKEEPIDPFTGKPLVYRVGNGELLIYSLGANLKDDGGRMTYKITQMVMDKDDDWTWREKIEKR